MTSGYYKVISEKNPPETDACRSYFINWELAFFLSVGRYFTGFGNFHACWLWFIYGNCLMMLCFVHSCHWLVMEESSLCGDSSFQSSSLGHFWANTSGWSVEGMLGRLIEVCGGSGEKSGNFHSLIAKIKVRRTQLHNSLNKLHQTSQ